MTTIKKIDNSCYIVYADGQEKAMLLKNYIGTHGHSRGWHVYNMVDGQWIWCGNDERITHMHFDDPAWMASIKYAKEYYGIA